MLKNIIGNWGSDLSDGDYACALAALGVLEFHGTEQYPASSDPHEIAAALAAEFEDGERTPVWRAAQNVGPHTTPALWQATRHTAAGALAEGWRLHLARCAGDPRRQPCLAVVRHGRADLFSDEALDDCLRHPEVGLAALVDELPSPHRPRVPWHWPLRVGVLPDGDDEPLLAPLQARQNKPDWALRLARPYVVGAAAHDHCDVLILTPRGLDTLRRRPRCRVRAGFVVCLADPDTGVPGADWRPLLDLLHAAGLAVQPGILGPEALGEWFVNLVFHASHDLPIHAAVTSASRHGGLPTPVVTGSAGALDGCRIMAIATHQDRLEEALQAREEQRLASTEQAGMARSFRSRRFMSETHDGVRAVEDLAQQHVDNAAAREPRWVQARLWSGEGAGAPEQALAPGRWNLLTAGIGPLPLPRDDAPFPESQLSFDHGDVTLTVQLEMTGVSLAPYPRRRTELTTSWAMLDGMQRADFALWSSSQPDATPADDGSAHVALVSMPITLPPVGDSTAACFGVFPQPGVERCDGRISIIHNNRVLQSSLLSIDVTGQATTGSPLRLKTESRIHARDDDLDERQAYDVAIQVSDLGGHLHLAIQRDDATTQVDLDSLEEPIALITKALKDAAILWDFTLGLLEQAAFGDTLYALAANGSLLAQHLRQKCGGGIDDWERIQLVPTTNKFLPLEYVYDGPPPSTDAAPCPNLLAALEHGSCCQPVAGSDACAPCPQRDDKGTICPLRFWGFSRMIERCGTQSPPIADQTASVPSKQPYRQVDRLLFGASARTFAYKATPAEQAAERTSLLADLGTLASTVLDAPDWTTWRQHAASNPELLVLLAHTDLYRNAPILEIGQLQRLGRQEIIRDISGANGQPQLLLLLGCSAASVSEDFQPYPERFRDAGVSIVLAPIAPIRGGDAVPIARSIATLLAHRLASPNPTSFGELLPQIRRQLLREGHLGILSIIGFGDGDWLLGGQ